MNHDIIRVRLQKIRHTRKLLQIADNKLSLASTDTDHAANTELLDIFTKSKAISFWSSYASSSAQKSLQEAKQAINNLNQALAVIAEEKLDYDANIPIDILDLSVDLFFSPNMDILSMSNFSSLCSASSKFSQMKQALSDLDNKLEQYEFELQKYLSDDKESDW